QTKSRLCQCRQTAVLRPASQTRLNCSKQRTLIRARGEILLMNRTYGDTAVVKVILTLGDGVFLEMKDRGGQRRARSAFGQALVNVLKVADAARGDYRYFHPVRYCAG